jgi:hypothetical protein
MDDGILSDFRGVSNYDFATDGFQYSILQSEESMIQGLYYRFKFRALNSYGASEFSDDLIVGLGPLPSKP